MENLNGMMIPKDWIKFNPESPEHMSYLKLYVENELKLRAELGSATQQEQDIVLYVLPEMITKLELYKKLGIREREINTLRAGIALRGILVPKSWIEFDSLNEDHHKYMIKYADYLLVRLGNGDTSYMDKNTISCVYPDYFKVIKKDTQDMTQSYQRQEQPRQRQEQAIQQQGSNNIRSNVRKDRVEPIDEHQLLKIQVLTKENGLKCIVIPRSELKFFKAITTSVNGKFIHVHIHIDDFNNI